MIVTGDVSPDVILGDVYVVIAPLAVEVGLKVPQGVSPEQDQVTPALAESLVTVAVKVAVALGQAGVQLEQLG